MNKTKQFKTTNSVSQPPIVKPFKKLPIVKKQKTLNQLVIYIKLIKNRDDMTKVAKYWLIGDSINKYYEDRGKVQIFSKLTKETGLGETHFILLKHFAKAYSRQQIQELLNGNFTIQWSHIVKYLFVHSNVVVDKYTKSQTADDFLIAMNNINIISNKNYSVKIYKRIKTSLNNKPNSIKADAICIC